MTALEPYSPRLLLEWQGRYGDTPHRALPGTLVFADVSGFTELSEKLERAGRVGAEQMSAVINGLFGELLMLAAARGGEMLKYGGDAMLLFFGGDGHAPRAAAASVDMQSRLRQIGRVDTGAGTVRLRMSVGAHSGAFDCFVAGRSHRELVVAGPDTTVTIAMEAAADATEVLVSPAMAELLSPRSVGAAKAGGFLLRGNPRAPIVGSVPLTGTFDATRFLDRRLVQHLSAGVLHPEHRLVTVAFLQFLDLDPLLLAARTDEAARRVDDVLSLVQECFDEYEVTFLATDLAANGAKVMAAAGAPVAHEDDDERMLRAARAILDAGPALPVRIGVNRGHVFVGDVGPSFRRTYTALGDVTNTAARVMGRAKPGQCLALEPVLHAATSEWSCERGEPFVAKGKTEPLVPWSIGVPGARRSRASKTPFVGRDAELATLAAELDAATRAARTVDVVGETGLGKSRLVAELAAIARSQGRPVVSVACDPFAATSPYRTVAALMAVVGGPTDRDALIAYAGAQDGALADELPLVGIALGIELPPTPTTAALDDAALPPRIATATARLLAALIPPGALLVIDDAHWVDQSSVPVLEALRRTEHQPAIESRASTRDSVAGSLSAPAFLLCATRREDDSGWVPSEPDAAIVLTGLDPAAALALVESASQRPRLPEEARRLAERAAGNPLFAEELAAAPLGVDLPDSLEEVIASRIDRLRADDRDVLRRLSVLGPVFDADLIPSVVTEGLPDSLSSFVARTGGDDGQLRFAHALLQQTAYAGLAFKRRRELHARVATHLMATSADNGRVEQLSRHCDAANMWPEAWRYASAAARIAESRYAFGIAARHWERAARAARQSGSIGATDVADAWFACGEARRRAGLLPDAEQAFRAGRRVAPPRSPQSVGLAAAVGRALLLEGRVGGAERWSRRAYRELGSVVAAPFEVEAWVEELRADVANHQQRFTDVLTLARELTRKAHDAGNLGVQVRAQGLVHAAAVALALPEADEEGARALELAERAGQVRSVLAALSNLADAADRRAEWDRAKDLYAQASEHAERGGFTLGRTVIDSNVGEILTRQGRIDEALPLFERSHSTAAAAGHWHAAFFTANIGWARGLLGQWDAAATAFDEAATAFRSLGLTAMLPEVDRRRVDVALVHGGADEVLALLGGALEAAAADPGDPALLAARSHAHRQRGEHEEACAAAEGARLAAEATDNAFGRLVAAEARFRLGGRDDAARIAGLSAALGIVARPAVP